MSKMTNFRLAAANIGPIPGEEVQYHLAVPPQLAFADQPSGLLCQRTVDQNVIAGPHQLLEVNQFDAEACGDFAVYRGIERQEPAHIEVA